MKLRALLLLFLFLAPPALAAGTVAATGGGTVTVEPALNRATLTHLLAVLRDPAQRNAFIATLAAMEQALAVKVEPAKPAAIQSPIPLQLNSLGATFLTGIATLPRRLLDEAGVMFGVVAKLKLVGYWVAALVTDAWLRNLFLTALGKLALVMAVGTTLEWGVRRALARPRAAISRKASEIVSEGRRGREKEAERKRRIEPFLLLRRVPFVLGRLALDLTPVLAFAVLANAATASALVTERVSRLMLLVVIDYYVAYRIVLAAVRFLVSPDTPALRLVHVSTATATYIVRWVQRIVVVIGLGYAAIEIGALFGLYDVAQAALTKFVALIVCVQIATIIWQKREAVASRLRGRAETTGALAGVRARIAETWHLIAIAYVMTLWALWAIGVPHAFERLLRLFFVAVVVGGLARWIWGFAAQVLERSLARVEEAGHPFAGLRQRLSIYHPILHSLLGTAIFVVAAITILEGWGVDAINWFAAGQLGGQVFSALLTIGFTLAGAVLVWEGMNAAVQHHLARLGRGAKAARAARLRTLLPMLRSALFVIIAIVVGLIVLSEFGVNIAPLLAGAGVVGLAIGFGSQKLVQDIITGLFLLLENAMQVGDVVALGGLSGVVENLSVRTIRLRAQDGSVHVIPFSAVTTVTNMTRDFAHAVLNIGVAYKENVDHVIEVVREIVRGMRHEPAWEDRIRDDLEVWGLDRFDSSAVVIVCRIKTGPSDRWAVEREFNRRMKIRFDELGIEIPYPYQRLVLDPEELRSAFAATREPQPTGGLGAKPRPADERAA